jgi:hypothetical protein
MVPWVLKAHRLSLFFFFEFAELWGGNSERKSGELVTTDRRGEDLDGSARDRVGISG